jgi:Lon protease-like protein
MKTAQTLPDPLPLFPLQTVLFPGGLLPLKIFEARYLDLASHCLRSGEPFGVVCMTRGAEAGSTPEGGMRIEGVGVLARIEEVDAEQMGILKLRCGGGSRFRLTAAPVQRKDGLWVAHGVESIADDERVITSEQQQPAVEALKEAAASLQAQGTLPFGPPLRWQDAGWVANRWCELLPIPLPAKQRLMELEDPGMRLKLVDEFLRSRQIVKG